LGKGASFETIIFEKQNGVGILKLNRPERMNAVSEKMYREIQDILAKAELDRDLRVLIITGSVLKKNDREKQAFCAGADLKDHSTGKRDYNQKREYILLAHETTYKIYNFPKPVIAAINGPARGAGAELALNCDFIFIANSATIAFPETGLGTFVGGGVTSHLPLIIGIMKAKELIYTGKVIDGKEAVAIGLALANCPVNNLLDTAKRFACGLSEKAPISLGLTKTRLQNSHLLDVKSALQYETESILSCMETEDWHEGINAFMEKRTPKYRGK
jgi:enoyl-CoA hydratase